MRQEKETDHVMLADIFPTGDARENGWTKVVLKPAA
jgi:hypothetical protein